MSHQTGIQCSDELKETFRKCFNEVNVRCFKIIIENESLVPSTTIEKRSDDWEAEFDTATKGFFKPKQPCYALYQLNTNSDWLLILYSPDDSPTRLKMLYAATRATLKNEIGGDRIKEEIYGNSPEEVSLAGYHSHKSLKAAPNPLTMAEEELKSIDDDKRVVGSCTRDQTSVQGVAFPITQGVEKSLYDFKDGVINHIELCIDIKEEIIIKKSAHSISAVELEGLISSEYASYHMFKYAHRHNDEDLEVNFFIYVMPGSSISVKNRMLYSSCKAPLIDVISGPPYDIPLEKRVECDSEDSITENFLRLEVHPPAKETKAAFSKPKAPGKRAPARRPNRNGA